MNDVGSSSASAPGSAGPAQVYSAPRADDRRVRLLVVDDHPVVRSGIVGMLSGEPDLQVVGQAADGAEAIALTADPLQEPDERGRVGTVVEARMPL